MPARDAIVIATFSRRMRLCFADRAEVDARIKGKKLKPVCGDRVRAEPIAKEDDWLITEIAPRTNELSRPNQRGQIEVLAANIDLLLVVAAVAPEPDWFIVDRYLCAAENMSADAAVLLNKCDLAAVDEATAALEAYQAIGYPALCVSAKTTANLDRVAALIDARTAIIVGQSGVGKSSLINSLSDKSNLKTSEISDKRGGRHTTVNSMMIALPGGGAVIDSPGVRDYAPALTSPVQAARGYREIDAFARNCRFSNCAHRREPECAVKAAVEAGEIDARRYQSYRRTLTMTERLSRGQH